MGFVKIDDCVLDSSLWGDFEAYRVFETGLLMCRPLVVSEAMAQYAVGKLEETGFVAPPGEYGFVAASGPGIIRKSLLPEEVGLAALERLGSPDEHSKDVSHDGRRMIRVDGGYLILNYAKYRQKDHTATERKQRERARRRKEEELECDGHDASRVTWRDCHAERVVVTQAEAEAEAEAENIPPTEEEASQEDHEVFRLAWNAVAAPCGLAECRVLSPGRKKAFRQRIRDPDWRAHYSDALARLPGIAWIKGRNDRCWKATVDWFLRPDTVTKLLEGVYDDNRRNYSTTSSGDTAGLF